MHTKAESDSDSEGEAIKSMVLLRGMTEECAIDGGCQLPDSARHSSICIYSVVGAAVRAINRILIASARASRSAFSIVLTVSSKSVSPVRK